MADAKGGDPVVLLNARMEALRPLLPEEDPDDRELDDRLAEMLYDGFEQVAGCVVWAACAETAARRYSIAELWDETGFESFWNHVHLEDVLGDVGPSRTIPSSAHAQLFAQAVLFARCLARDLARAFPGDPFEVQLGVSQSEYGYSYTVRFYKSRPGQRLLLDDLESYEDDAILLLLVFPRC